MAHPLVLKLDKSCTSHPDGLVYGCATNVVSCAVGDVTSFPRQYTPKIRLFEAIVPARHESTFTGRQ